MVSRSIAFLFLVVIVAAFLGFFVVLKETAALDNTVVSVVAIVVAGGVFVAAINGIRDIAGHRGGQCGG